MHFRRHHLSLVTAFPLRRSTTTTSYTNAAATAAAVASTRIHSLCKQPPLPPGTASTTTRRIGGDSYYEYHNHYSIPNRSNYYHYHCYHQTPSIVVALQRKSYYHTTCASWKKYGGKSGKGGDDEERHIAQAIRTIRDRPYRVVVEVMNATHLAIAHRYLSIRHIFKNKVRDRDNPPLVWIRILTHADLLSPKALQYQIHQAGTLTPLGGNINVLSQGNGRNDNNKNNTTPVMAVSIPNLDATKSKQLRQVYQLLAGAETTALDQMDSHKHSNSMLVTGLPNAGKSTLIHALTKARTIKVKKKKTYHLPKVNATAGWTLGCKTHVFEYGDYSHSFSMTDTPGMRPSRAYMNDNDMAYLVATGSMSLPKQRDGGEYDPPQLTRGDLLQPVVDIFQAGLQRHEAITGEAWNQSAWKMAIANLKVGSLGTLIKETGLGKYGKLIIEQQEGASSRSTTTAVNDDADDNKLLKPAPPLILGMNATAAKLVETGKKTYGDK